MTNRLGLMQGLFLVLVGFAAYGAYSLWNNQRGVAPGEQAASWPGFGLAGKDSVAAQEP